MKQSDAKRKRGQADEEAEPVRQQIREIVEGKFVTLVMTLTTLFALFGDDMRLWMTTKKADPAFFIGLIISFILFSLELLINSCVVDEFKYSFFFWLDFIATLSLVPDIPWFVDYINAIMGFQESIYEVDVIPGTPLTSDEGSNLAKILKSVRLIRLIRIIKLYNYAVKSNSEAEEAKLREQAKQSANQQIAALKKELEPSRLGKHLSDHLTRLLIIGILLLLMVLPLLSYEGSNYTTLSGLREIFWFGSSSCKPIEGEDTNKSMCNNVKWITKEGWEEKLRHFIESQKASERDLVEKELLWLYVPDFNKQGILDSIPAVPDRLDSSKMMWNQDDDCSGFKVSNKPCHLRVDEMQLIGYQPRECRTGEKKNCGELIAYARFNIRQQVINEAQMAFSTTIFTCIIMCIGSLAFSADTEKIIIQPITKMVGIIKQLADDPL